MIRFPCNLAVVLMGMMPLAGQEPVGAAPPNIPFEHQRDYYRADGRMQRAAKAVEEAQKLLETANAELREAGNAIVTDCGTDYLPSEDPGKKSLVCAAKPKAQGK